jgi:hypothetical protein
MVKLLAWTYGPLRGIFCAAEIRSPYGRIFRRPTSVHVGGA